MSGKPAKSLCIAVAFLQSPSKGSWIGGYNYFKNMFLMLLDAGEIEPVLLVGRSRPDPFVEDLPMVRRLKTALVDRWTPKWIVRKVLGYIFSRDILLERLLIRAGISVLSHSGQLGRQSRFPTIGWIPDFQHVAIPANFSIKELQQLDYSFAKLCNYCTVLVVSSVAVKRDLIRFAPNAESKVAVVPFTALPVALANLEARDTFLERYHIPPRYFAVPNQFWVHKNHALLIEAAALVERDVPGVRYSLSGHTGDHRDVSHFNSLKKMIAERGLEANFLILGVIPQADVTSLIRNSVALINPSKFEGWSTTVEEAKALGKMVLLSSIEPHLEQKPASSRYFSPNSSEQLAQVIIETWRDCGMPDADLAVAQNAVMERRNTYASLYAAAVRRALSHRGTNVSRLAPASVQDRDEQQHDKTQQPLLSITAPSYNQG